MTDISIKHRKLRNIALSTRHLESRLGEVARNDGGQLLHVPESGGRPELTVLLVSFTFLSSIFAHPESSAEALTSELHPNSSKAYADD